MSLDDKFDKSIRQKISEAEFPFDESNWQKASKMIDAERGASAGIKSGKMFLMVGTLFLGVAAGTFFFLYLNPDREQTQLSENAAQNSAVVSMQGANEVQNHAEVSQGMNAVKQEESNASAVSQKVTENNSSAETGASGNTKAEVALETSKAANTEASETPVSTASAESKDANAASAKPLRPSNSTPAEKMTRADHKPSKFRKPLGGKESQTNSLAKGEQSATSQPQDILNAAAAQPMEGYDYLEMHSSVLQLWKKDEVLKNSPHDFIRIWDEDYYKKARRKTAYVDIEAGGAYMFGWQGADGNDGSGLNPFAGVNLGVFMGKRMSLVIGAQYYQVGHIKQAYYKRESKEYDFGYNGKYVEITNNSLSYVGVPVKIQTGIFKTARIGAGVNTGFLFSGKNTMTTWAESDGLKSNVQTTTGKGYYEGVNTWNVMLSAFYAQSITRRLSVNGEVMYGLSDTYKESATLNKTKENQVGVRLSLLFNIFEK